MTHLFLIGYRGSGRSTVGRRLAQELQRGFVDTDDEVERKSGKDDSRDLRNSGRVRGFRKMEEAAIVECLATDQPFVIALGGGAVLSNFNREQIREHGAGVWLIRLCQGPV